MCLPSRSYQESSSFADRVLQWGGQNFSDFPWRLSRSPYEILVAETTSETDNCNRRCASLQGLPCKIPLPTRRRVGSR